MNTNLTNVSNNANSYIIMSSIRAICFIRVIRG